MPLSDDILHLTWDSMPLSMCLRAGLQQLGATSHPQLGAASQPQLGAGAAQGAGASQQLGAGAAHGAGSQQIGAGSQQFLAACNLPIMPLSLWPSWSFGRQTGAASQQLGAGASQHTGAGSQQLFFLQNKPADAPDEEMAAKATADKVIINRRMEQSPKQKVFSKPRREHSGCRTRPGLNPVATLPE